MRDSQQFNDGAGGQLDDSQIGSGEENNAGDDDNSNNSLTLNRHDDINNDDEMRDGDDDDDETDGDPSNFPLNLVATQLAD